MFKNLFGFITCAILLCFSNTSNAANIVSTFDTGIDGWGLASGNRSDSLAYNPAGFITYTDKESSWLYAVAPSKFHGDWSNFTSLSVDVLGIKKAPNRNLIFEISGPNGSATYSFPKTAVVLGEWNTLSADLLGDSWSIKSGNWDSIISNINDFRIMMDLTNGVVESNGLDNVILTDPSIPAPEPSSFILGLASLGGLIARRRKNA